MLNLLLALAYLQEGSVEDALVEARKVDKKLEAINSQYPKGKKNGYKEDAFVRWLMGMLYEIDPTSANLNDAFISYRKALNIYKKDYRTDYGLGPPVLLKKQYLRLAEWAPVQRCQVRVTKGQRKEIDLDLCSLQREVTHQGGKKYHSSPSGRSRHQSGLSPISRSSVHHCGIQDPSFKGRR